MSGSLLIQLTFVSAIYPNESRGFEPKYDDKPFTIQVPYSGSLATIHFQAAVLLRLTTSAFIGLLYAMAQPTTPSLVPPLSFALQYPSQPVVRLIMS